MHELLSEPLAAYRTNTSGWTDQLTKFTTPRFLAAAVIFIGTSLGCARPSLEHDGKQWTTVFEARTCCDLFPPSTGYWVRISKAPLGHSDNILSAFKLFFVERKGAEESMLHSEDLGEGAWCHILMCDLGVTGREPEWGDTKIDKSKADAMLFFWVDGQATRAYAFRIRKSSISKVFEEIDGRSWYSFQDVDCDGTYEIVQHDSSWHLAGGFPANLEAKLQGHEFGKVIYKFDGQIYKLFDIQPDDQTKAK